MPLCPMETYNGDMRPDFRSIVAFHEVEKLILLE